MINIKAKITGPKITSPANKFSLHPGDYNKDYVDIKRLNQIDISLHPSYFGINT